MSKHTIYAWKPKYGGMEVSEAEEVKHLRDENARLKKLARRLMIPASGECQEAYASTDKDDNISHYAGLEQSENTGIQHAIYRDYDSSLGRWQSPDSYTGSYDLTNSAELHPV